MQLDSFTILAAGSALLILEGMGFLYFWLRERGSPWMLLWGIPFILGGAALWFYMSPHWQTNAFAISLGNAARMLAIIAMWQGVRVFHGRTLQWWLLALVGVGWIALVATPLFAHSMLARIIAISLINAAACAAAAFELWRGRSEALPSRRALVATFASFSVLMLVRGAIAGFTPFPVGTEAMDGIWFGAFMLLVFGHSAFAALLFFALTRERREAEQRSFALSDPLTGLLNRRAFGDYAERMGRRRSGPRGASALLVLDLDHFKQVNDQFGHEAGDRMLKAFADTAESCVRPADQLFRMGGEEFCFVLPDTNLDVAVAVAENIRRVFEATQVDTTSGPASATVSIGIAATSFAIDIGVLLAAADAAVYEAKARGRNRVVVAEPGAIRRGGLTDVLPPSRLSA